jgi:hypothetical protein
MIPRTLSVVLVWIAVWHVPDAQAARLDFEPFISTGVHYSDNIELQPRAQAEKDTVLEVAPGFALEYPGRSFSTDIQYRAQGLYYRENSDRDELYSQLNANALASAADQWFLRLGSNINQQVVDPARSAGTSNIPATGNRTDVRRNSVNPYWAGGFGSGVRAGAGYTHTDVAYDQQVAGSLEDSDVNTVNAYIGNTPEDFSWLINHSDREAEYAGGSESRFRRTSLELGVPVAARTSLTATYGSEDNEYPVPPGVEPPEGSFWTVGLKWVDPGRGRFEIAAGERFFGKTYRLLLERSGRYLDTELSYNEELTTDNQLEPVAGVTDQIDSTTDLTRLSTEVFLNREARWRLSYRRSKTGVSLLVRRREREFQGDGSETVTLDARLRLDWRIAARTTVLLEGLRRDDEFRGRPREDELTEARLGLERRVGPRTAFDVSLRSAKRESNAPGAGYRERGASMTLTRNF